MLKVDSVPPLKVVPLDHARPLNDETTIQLQSRFLLNQAAWANMAAAVPVTRHTPDVFGNSWYPPGPLPSSSPIHHHSPAQSFSSSASGNDESSLRRKTPRGIVNGAFQSSLRQSPANKHHFAPHISARPNVVQPSSPYPSYDSMIFQNAGYPLQYVNPLAQNAATVIQHPNFPCGPTASGSGGQGPYGPYWHDGTFVPYRPYAVRDPRFYPHFTHQQPALQDMHINSSYPSFHPHHVHNIPRSHSVQLRSAVGYPVTFPAGSPTTSSSFIEPMVFGRSYGSSTTSQPSEPLPFSKPLSDAEAGGADAQHRERIFNLALNTYRELLTFLESVRKVNARNRNGNAHSRPIIYPKPPSSSNGHSPVIRDDLRSPVDSPQLAPKNDNSPLGGASSMPIHQAAAARTSENLLGHSCEKPRDNGHPAAIPGRSMQLHQPQQPLVWPQSTTGNKPDGRSTPYHSSEHLLAKTMNIAAHNTVWPRASNALKSLEQLCIHTNWQWIDGLNLSGCLAYGLEDYKKALELYNRVLQLDPKHVEASANLAATLLVLGYRKEAEQHWTRVIKQAPGYFEAVEHLVGLLCSSGRSKDAVKVIEYVERSLRMPVKEVFLDHASDVSSLASRSPCMSEISDKACFDYEVNDNGLPHKIRRDSGSAEPGFGSSGYAIPGADNGRMLALVHAKGNLMYSQGDNNGAARAFEDVVLIAVGRRYKTIKAVVQHVLKVISPRTPPEALHSADPILLHPEQAIHIASKCFPNSGQLNGLLWLPQDSNGLARKGAILTTSNSLLSLAKIFQDGMSSTSRGKPVTQLVSGVREILALYYLSLSLQPSPSTANNVGILLAGVQQCAPSHETSFKPVAVESRVPGVVPGSGVALALAYYNYGLILDSRHAHLYTNLGSLLKDIGQLDAAIEMYKRAVQCDGKFDIALANLANAVKDKGRISEAIDYYTRAVEVNPDFAEAVCGLANALNSVCRWRARGGIAHHNGKRDRWHVNDNGMLVDSSIQNTISTGWIKRVVDIVERQLQEGKDWGHGSLTPAIIDDLTAIILSTSRMELDAPDAEANIRKTLMSWSGQKYEGARLLRLVERITRRVSWAWYRDKNISKKERNLSSYRRPQLPPALVVPSAPTVLPFHTFTSPVSAEQVRLISQRNGYRISASTLKTPWLPTTVFPPPAPPAPVLRVGYVSSDFNNHPLAHLMQSVFGLHDRARVKAYCYATTAGDNSSHRKQIESEAPHFVDASSWPTEQLVSKIVDDGIHILINLNGYTRGARNEVFAARPAPIQMSFMGFAGTLGAEWCDYLLADSTSVPTSTLRPWRRNVDISDQFCDENNGGEDDAWVYGENIIYCRSTFFCCDHRQSAPDASAARLSWEEEQAARWKMRQEIFPNLASDTIIFANFNQLYKIEPTTFRSWLRILARVPNAILWLLRFPDLGEANLLHTAQQWAGSAVASRVVFTDVAPKNMHITRAKIVDLFLDTPECNAHTTAADVLWSGTPLLTLPRYEYKMCSRMAASILRGALPREPQAERERAEQDLVASSEEEYEMLAVKLGNDLRYPRTEAEGSQGIGRGRLVELRRLLTDARWSSDLFDTRRWVADLEDAYDEAWRRWVDGKGGDIWLDDLPKGRTAPLP